MRATALITIACVLLFLTASAEAGTKMTMQCQQNLSDGRVLVSDGTLLPENARFKVLSYKPARKSDGWSYGTCVLDVTQGAVD